MGNCQIKIIGRGGGGLRERTREHTHWLKAFTFHFSRIQTNPDFKGLWVFPMLYGLFRQTLEEGENRTISTGVWLPKC